MSDGLVLSERLKLRHDGNEVPSGMGMERSQMDIDRDATPFSLMCEPSGKNRSLWGWSQR